MVSLSFKLSKLFVNRGISGAMSLRFACDWVMYHLCVWHGAVMSFFARARLFQLTGSDEPMLPLNELEGHFLMEYLPLTMAATLLT